jgi:hypothetical protein
LAPLRLLFVDAYHAERRITSTKKVNIETKKKVKASVSRLTTFDEHLDKRYGRMGSAKRNEFEIKAKAFAIGEIKGEELRLASMTQEQLAEKAK